jgi:hypothetical protein
MSLFWTDKMNSMQIPSSHAAISKCARCEGLAFWVSARLVEPCVSIATPAHIDMPDKCRDDFEEARAIVDRSPRAAAALLRLALQKLMVHLGQSGKDLNQDIGNLVKKGLGERVQKALDTCRVVGNESVHPGTLDVRDNPEIAHALFELMNFIVEELISRDKRIDALYQTLPATKLQGIADRDSTASPAPSLPSTGSD